MFALQIPTCTDLSGLKLAASCRPRSSDMQTPVRFPSRSLSLLRGCLEKWPARTGPGTSATCDWKEVPPKHRPPLEYRPSSETCLLASFGQLRLESE